MLTISKKRELALGAAVLLAAFLIFRARETWFQIGIVMGMAALFSLVLVPVCTKLEHWGVGRSAACLISVLLLLMFLLFFLISFVPYLISHAVSLAKRISPTVTLMLEQGEQMIGIWGGSFLPRINLPQMIASAAAPLTAGIAKGSVAAVSAIGKLIMALVIAYYLLTVRKAAGRHLLLLIPTGYRRGVLSAVMGVKNAVLGYLSGVIKTGIFVGGATFLGLVALGVREAVILALFMGLLESFPYIGPVLGSIPILLSVIPMGMGKTIMAILLILAIQQVESGIIGPYFTASSTSIHPLAAIVSVYVGGSLFGFAGILFAVPSVVIVRSVFWSLRNASILQEA